MSVFEGAVDAVFATLGIDATYRPLDETQPDVAVRILWKSPDMAGLLGPGVVSPALTAELRASEATPVEGGAIVVGETSYRIAGAPKLDRDGLVYSIELEE